MKTFFYRVETVRNTRNGYRIMRVHLWEVKANDVAGYWTEEFSFLGDFQAAQELAERLKLCKPANRNELNGSAVIRHENGFTFSGNARFKGI
jgi:hypothetical protein